MKSRTIVAGLMMSLLLVGCGSGSSSSSNNSSGSSAEEENPVAQDVSFDYDFSSVITQELATVKAMQSSAPAPKNLAANAGSSEAGANANSGILSIQASDLMTGNLTVTNIDSGVVDIHAWTVYMDAADLNDVQSQKTLALVPGNYSFSLVLTKGAHQYVGEAALSVNDTAEALAVMSISPVIGDTLDAVDVTDLVDFKFQYLVSELTAADLSVPSIGITIDNNNEQIFALNPATGLSESMYLNLMPGSYNIALRLLDGNVQVGRSVSAQESSVLVSPGLDVNMDIIPLHAEVGLALAVEGGDAAFNFSIPSVVVEEAGGIANLDALFSVVGDENVLQESLLSLTQNGDVYEASVTLAGMYYGDVTLSLSFTDINDSELLGSCLNTVTLSVDTNSVVCDLDLRRRSVIAGSILSVLGVNVFAANGEPVAGAVISVDAEDVAMTNSAVFSTLGYSKLYLKAGTRTVRATANGLYGEVSIDSIPLDVTNVDITLDQAVLAQVTFSASPEGAEVVVGGANCTITNGNCVIELAVADYTAELSAVGYNSATTAFSVVDANDIAVDLGSLLVVADLGAGCSGTASFSVQMTPDIWICATNNLIGKTWPETYGACNEAEGFYLASVGPMTRRGLPSDADISVAMTAAAANNHDYVTSGHPARSTSWDSVLTNYETTNGLGYINTSETTGAGINWVAISDGNDLDHRNWPAANDTGAHRLASLCMNASADPVSYVFDHRWR